MKFFSTALKQHIANGTICTCIKLTDSRNNVYGFTEHDTKLEVDGVMYAPSAGLQRLVMNLRNNAEVSNQEMISAWTLDLPEEDLRNGLFDNAELDVFKVSWADTTIGTISVFKGRIGDVEWSVDGFKADVMSSMQQLSKSIGTTVTLKCRHDLFSTASDTQVGFCGVNKASYTYNSSIGAVTTQKIKFTVPVGAIAIPSGHCSNGVLVWTSGLNNGFESVVKTHVIGGGQHVFELFLPTNLAMNVGDTFTVYAGCNKTTTQCKDKFNNIINYGGFPHIRNGANFR